MRHRNQILSVGNSARRKQETNNNRISFCGAIKDMWGRGLYVGERVICGGEGYMWGKESPSKSLSQYTEWTVRPLNCVCVFTHIALRISLPLCQPVNCTFWPLRTLNWLVAANKLHNDRAPCCAAEWPSCSFPIRCHCIQLSLTCVVLLVLCSGLFQAIFFLILGFPTSNSFT